MITYWDTTLMRVLSTPVTQYGTTIKNKLLIRTPFKVHNFFDFFKCSHKGSLGTFNWMEKLIIILPIFFLKKTLNYICISSLKRNQKKNTILSTDLLLRKHHLSKCSPDTFGFKKTVINRLSFIQHKRYHSLIFTEQEKSS